MQKRIQQNKRWKRKISFTQFDTAFSWLQTFCQKTHPNTIFGHLFQRGTIVPHVLALHECNTVVVTLQLLSLLHF